MSDTVSILLPHQFENSSNEDWLDNVNTLPATQSCDVVFAAVAGLVICVFQPSNRIALTALTKHHSQLWQQAQTFQLPKQATSESHSTTALITSNSPANHTTWPEGHRAEQTHTQHANTIHEGGVQLRAARRPDMHPS